MKEGWWINIRSGNAIEIDEHEQWLRRPGNANKLGVPSNVQDDFDKFEPIKDRNEFLLYVMRKSPIMRVRGHGASVTFEYASRDRMDVMDSIFLWGLRNAGPFTNMYIVNFATKEHVRMNWGEFEALMNDVGPEGVMRSASRLNISQKVEAKIASITGSLVNSIVS